MNLKKNYEKRISEKKSLHFILEKKENLFQLFEDLGGGRKRIFLHRSVLFIARENNEVSHAGSPP